MVQGVISRTMTQYFWVEAELAEANERRGHLYLDLIQKDEGSATPVARAQARCWASTWAPLRRRFEQATGQALAPGMKVLLQVYAQFHVLYGFSWIVTDIDATYTIGDMARRRQEIIATLKEEGVFDLQKQLTLPLFCQRIAVISSQTAAGYGDFCNQLADNDYGFVFHTELFPAIMQGEQVERSVIAALDRINERMTASDDDPFDCVVIIRGGGATTDMSGFDTLPLAENVANFPIPIITGIGHDRDECILDMVAHTRVKTPTAAAAFLIDNLVDVAAAIDAMADDVAKAVRLRLEQERVRITTLSTRLPMLFSLVRSREENHLAVRMQRLHNAVGNRLQREHHRLEMLAQRASLADPQLMLSRGYSMTTSGGKIIKDASQLMDGEIIVTRLAKGEITSKVWKKQ